MRSFTLEPLPPETTQQASRVPRKTWDRAPKPIWMMAKLNDGASEFQRVRIGLASGGLGIHRSLTWPKRLQRWEVSHIHSGLSVSSGGLLYWEAKRLLDVVLLIGLYFGVSFDQDARTIADRLQNEGVTEKRLRWFICEANVYARTVTATQIAVRLIRQHNRGQ